MSNINAQAAAVREAHRTSTGQFGEQGHSAPHLRLVEQETAPVIDPMIAGRGAASAAMWIGPGIDELEDAGIHITPSKELEQHYAREIEDFQQAYPELIEEYRERVGLVDADTFGHVFVMSRTGCDGFCVVAALREGKLGERLDNAIARRQGFDEVFLENDGEIGEAKPDFDHAIFEQMLAESALAPDQDPEYALQVPPREYLQERRWLNKLSYTSRARLDRDTGHDRDISRFDETGFVPKHATPPF